MTCQDMELYLAGYLDGTIPSRTHAIVRFHLDSCGAFREQLEQYRKLSVCLASVERVEAPADLATKIRVRASQVQPMRARWKRAASRLGGWFEDILQPFAVPATGGIVTALVVFVFLVQNILVGIPLNGVVQGDMPLNLVEPASLVSLAPFPVPGFSDDDAANSGTLLLEATLNAEGQVVYYHILSGPNSNTVKKQIDQLLLFSRFRPQLSFGRPTDGGRVLLNFSEVHVRG